MSGEPLVIRSGHAGELSGTSTGQVDEIAARLAGSRRVVMHFHGGLVDEPAGLAIAAGLDPVYRAGGTLPVFFVWRSGLPDTLRGNLKGILTEDIFTRMLRWVLRYCVGKLRDPGGARGAFGVHEAPVGEVNTELAGRDGGHEPFAALRVAPALVEPLNEQEAAYIQQLMEQDTALQIAFAEVAPSVGPVGARGVSDALSGGRPTLMDPEVVAELAGGPGSRGIISTGLLVRRCVVVLRRVLERFRAGTGHGIYPTVVEELLRAFYLAHAGAALWGAMKQATRSTFEPGPGARAGHVLLDRLRHHRAAGGSDPEIVLVGHSAGSVFINNFLTVARDLAVAKVAYLAPACTTAAFAGVLGDWPDDKRKFRMFTMTDEAERADRLVGALYPRSLLYLVSAVLERGKDGAPACTPLLGLARHLDPGGAQGTGSRLVRDFVTAPAASRLVLSPGDDGPGRRSGARTHGAFDDDDLVRGSLQDFVGDPL